MQARPWPDAIDTRIVFQAYAAVAWTAGILLSGWGPVWFGAHLAGQPWGKAALIRVFGSFVIAAGCFAAALARVEDPESRRRSLFWFGAAHAVVLVAVSLQQIAIWGPGLADWAAGLLWAAVLAFFYLWQTAAGEQPGWRSSWISLFGRSPSPAEQLRSAYEQQIRQAAAHEERNRLARDLHDSIKQQIFVIQTAAATAQARLDKDRPGARHALDAVRSSAREAITEMDAMLDQLRAAPLENVGLVEALKKQCEALGFRTGARVEFRLGKLPPSEILPPGAQQAILRVAQEAMANIARHARARDVLVRLDSAGHQLVLRVRDDGAGFDPDQSARGMGIANMRARAEGFRGSFELESRPGGGTAVTFSIPFIVRTPAEYRRQAMMWGGVLIFSIVLTVWKPRPTTSSLLLLFAIAFARALVAWQRTRKQLGAGA